MGLENNPEDNNRISRNAFLKCLGVTGVWVGIGGGLCSRLVYPIRKEVGEIDVYPIGTEIADYEAKIKTLEGITPPATSMPTDTPTITPEPTQCPPGENPEHQKLVDLENEFLRRGVLIESGVTVKVLGRSYVLTGIKVDDCNVTAVWSAFCPTPEIPDGGDRGGNPPKNPPENPPGYPPEQ